MNIKTNFIYGLLLQQEVYHDSTMINLTRHVNTPTTHTSNLTDDLALSNSSETSVVMVDQLEQLLVKNR